MNTRDCAKCKKLVFRNVAGEEINTCPYAGMTVETMEMVIAGALYGENRQVPAVPPCLPNGWPHRWLQKWGATAAEGRPAAFQRGGLPLTFRSS